MSIDISSSLPSIQKVSVIVPCYNYGHFLGAALQSVQAQTLREWECIIVDDGSSDDTRAVAARYAALDTRIQYLFQTNSGHSAARNRGLEAAQGQYLQFLDADDLLQPHKLELQAAFLDSHPSVDIVYGNHRYFTEETAQEALIAPLGNAEQPKKPDQDCQIQTLLIERNIMVTHAPLFRRRVIEVIGLMDNVGAPAAREWSHRAARERRLERAVLLDLQRTGQSDGQIFDPRVGGFGCRLLADWRWKNLAVARYIDRDLHIDFDVDENKIRI